MPPLARTRFCGRNILLPRHFFFFFVFWFAHSKKQYLRNNASSLDGDFRPVTHDQTKNLVLSNELIKVELPP